MDDAPLTPDDKAVKRVSFLQSLEGLPPIEVLRRKKERNLKSRKRREKKLKELGIKAKYHNSRYFAKKKILKGRSHGFCMLCRGEFASADLTMDHIVPVSHGGNFKKENLQMICRPCHDKKELALKDLPRDLRATLRTPDGN